MPDDDVVLTHPEYEVELHEGAEPDSPPGAEPSPTTEPRPAGEVPGARRPASPERGGPPQQVPYERLQQIAQARQQEYEGRVRAEERARMLEEQLTRLQYPQSAAPPQEESAEDREIRESLERLYPALRSLKDLPIDKVLKAMERVDSIDANDQARWEDVGRRTWDALDQQIEKHYGGRIEDGEMRDTIYDAFQLWLRRSEQAQAMYLRQDPELVPSFWKRYAGAIVRPAVRRAEAQTVSSATRRQPNAPRGGSQTTVTTAPRQPNPEDPEAIHEAAADAFLQRRG
jgi:hypothetical protein